MSWTWTAAFEGGTFNDGAGIAGEWDAMMRGKFAGQRGGRFDETKLEGNSRLEKKNIAL